MGALTVTRGNGDGTAAEIGCTAEDKEIKGALRMTSGKVVGALRMTSGKAFLLAKRSHGHRAALRKEKTT